jgi:Na+-exporting ATPase
MVLSGLHRFDEHLVDVRYSHGLTTADAVYRLERDGPNRLQGDEGASVWGILIRQVSNSLTLVSGYF